MLSADGCVEVLNPVDTGCCPPPLCGNDLCCTFVAFFQLLPSGPMWDYWKDQAISYFQSNEDPAQCPLITNPQCPSIILHAIYTVLKLRSYVHGALWPALRESNPYTAVTTLDDWLRRYQWEDCYNSHCRSVLVGQLSPLEVLGTCGPIFCEPSYPDDLKCAIKRGIAIALTRASMGVIKNLCSINWIVEPLGAEIVAVIPEPCIDPPDPPYPDQTPPLPPHDGEFCYDPPEPWKPECTDCDEEPCGPLAFVVRPTRDWIEGCGTGDVCETLVPRPHIQAFWDWGGICERPAGLPEKVWPGVLAAECIIRSMMPPSCPSNITREC